MANVPVDRQGPARDGKELPQPLHLFEFLTRSQHYHFGYFEADEEALGEAMDCLALRSVPHLPRGSRVLDVGCGIGGTSMLLAAKGFEVVGIDPCAEAISYALRRCPPDRAVRLLSCELRELGKEHLPTRFGALILTEVMQHFRSLEELFPQCRALLEDDGRIVIHDIALNGDAAGSGAPFHPQGALRAAADDAGFQLVVQEDVTARVVPTLPHLTALLRDGRPDIVRFFGESRGAIEEEVEELAAQVRLLEDGFAQGHLKYEATVLRLPGRA